MIFAQICLLALGRYAMFWLDAVTTKNQNLSMDHWLPQIGTWFHYLQDFTVYHFWIAFLYVPDSLNIHKHWVSTPENDKCFHSACCLGNPILQHTSRQIMNNIIKSMQMARHQKTWWKNHICKQKQEIDLTCVCWMQKVCLDTRNLVSQFVGHWFVKFSNFIMQCLNIWNDVCCAACATVILPVHCTCVGGILSIRCALVQVLSRSLSEKHLKIVMSLRKYHHPINSTWTTHLLKCFSCANVKDLPQETWRCAQMRRKGWSAWWP